MGDFMTMEKRESRVRRRFLRDNAGKAVTPQIRVPWCVVAYLNTPMTPQPGNVDWPSIIAEAGTDASMSFQQGLARTSRQNKGPVVTIADKDEARGWLAIAWGCYQNYVVLRSITPAQMNPRLHDALESKMIQCKVFATEAEIAFAVFATAAEAGVSFALRDEKLAYAERCAGRITVPKQVAEMSWFYAGKQRYWDRIVANYVDTSDHGVHVGMKPLELAHLLRFCTRQMKSFGSSRSSQRATTADIYDDGTPDSNYKAWAKLASDIKKVMPEGYEPDDDELDALDAPRPAAPKVTESIADRMARLEALENPERSRADRKETVPRPPEDAEPLLPGEVAFMVPAGFVKIANGLLVRGAISQDNRYLWDAVRRCAYCLRDKQQRPVLVFFLTEELAALHDHACFKVTMHGRLEYDGNPTLFQAMNADRRADALQTQLTTWERLYRLLNWHYGVQDARPPGFPDFR